MSADQENPVDYVGGRVRDPLRRGHAIPATTTTDMFAATLADTIALYAADIRRRTPYQLPLSAPTWIDRATELDTLHQLGSRDGPRRAVLIGIGGVGKTALAVRFLNDLRHTHPHGALYADLGDSHRPRTPPTQILAGWLRELGIPADDIPTELHEAVALYRSVTADRELVVLIDNAAAPAHVRQLIPASPTAVTVVTSRRQLTGLRLDGFEHLRVDCFPTDTGADLLADVAGLTEPVPPPHRQGLRRLAQRCHGHPLALAIAGAQLAAHPQHDPDDLITRMARRATGLDWRLDDVSVKGLFDMAYDNLSAIAARLYQLLPSHPGEEFTIEPIAAGLSCTITLTRQALDELIDTNLVTEVHPDRYWAPRVITEHAAATAEHPDPTDDDPDDRPADGHTAECRRDRRDDALRRMISWYLYRAAAVDVTLNRLPRRFSTVYNDLDSTVFPDEHSAVDWFAEERLTVQNCQIIAAEHGWHDLVTQLAEVMWNPLRPNHATDDLARTQELGAAAARAYLPALEPVCLSRLAYAETNRGHHSRAVQLCTDAHRLAVDLNDLWIQATALSTRARAHQAADNPRAALPDLAAAVELDEQLGNERGVALRLRRLGQALAHPKIADYPLAITRLESSARIFRALGDEVGHARALTYLAETLLAAGQPQDALTQAALAVELLEPYGPGANLGHAHTVIGAAHAAQGATEHAHAAYTQAIAHYTTGPGHPTKAAHVHQLKALLD